MFSSLSYLPADPILGLAALFKSDKNDQKVDLGVGVYKNTRGQTPIMRSVKDAYLRLAQEEDSKSYISPMGWPGYTTACKGLALSSELTDQLEGRLAALQTPGGCGALRLGFDLIAGCAPGATVWVSNPTWANHVPTLTAAGLKSRYYSYYCPNNGLVDVQAMLKSLEQASKGDVILLHACCHNPTGADIPTGAFEVLVDMILQKGLLPFVDMAYQGFGTGLEEDTGLTRKIFATLPEALLSYSCSKNFGLYRERVGSLIVKATSSDRAKVVESNIARIARQSYSMPPAHGAALVTTVLEDQALRKAWEDELNRMRQRITSLRSDLASALTQHGIGNRLGNIASQKGMFSLLNLSEEQVSRLQSKYSIYMPANGRINIAGLTSENIPYVAEALASVSS